jgi:putative addiction module antidote
MDPMDRLEIQKIGNSAGVILSEDLLAHLQVKVGQALSVTVTPRGVELRAASGDFEEQMTVARGVMRKNRRALHELAKY